MTGIEPATSVLPRSSAEPGSGTPSRPGERPTTQDGAAPASIGTASTVVALTVGLVALLVLALAVGGGGPRDALPGFAQAGPLVDWGLPISRLAARLAALGTVGGLLFAAVLLPGRERTLPAASRRAMRAASLWALAWAMTTVLSAVLTLSEQLGVAPASLSSSSVWTFVTDVPSGRAAVFVTAVAVLLALAGWRCGSAAAAAALLATALSGLVLPAVLAGHSATADHHVLAVSNLSVHVVSAAVWVGGLLALLTYGRHRDDRAVAAARYSTVALGCFVATGTSGLLAAGLVVGGGSDALAAVAGTGYGWLLAGKTAGLAALGVFGWHHRRRTLPGLNAGDGRGFARFASVEAVVMLATIVLAVALSASPPPASSPPAAAQPSAQAAQPGQEAAASPEPGLEDMTGHDHGDLSVTVLIDETRFHVAAPVAPGARVTVHNGTSTEVTITASDGSFDAVIPGGTLTTFEAPAQPGTYPFLSRHSPTFTGLLVVR